MADLNEIMDAAMWATRTGHSAQIGGDEGTL